MREGIARLLHSASQCDGPTRIARERTRRLGYLDNQWAGLIRVLDDGRLEEELAALRGHGIPCEVVPGVSAALAAAAHTQRPLTRRGNGRSVSLTTAMTHLGTLQASRTADTEVFYMAGRQLAALSLKLLEAGWPADTPASVVSNAGWPDARCTDHTVATLADGTAPHANRPAVVTVGAGALAVVTHTTDTTDTTDPTAPTRSHRQDPMP